MQFIIKLISFILTGEEDDESSEPEDNRPPSASRLSATPTGERQSPGGQTPIETDAEQK